MTFQTTELVCLLPKERENRELGPEFQKQSVTSFLNFLIFIEVYIVQ